MHEARVLVVDDSAAMRALFCDVLEQSKNVRVVGTAASAAEARDQIAQCMPNVLTLDVEMPGMSGIEFLEEIMSTNPMPVVMLSGLTQSGTETSLKAFELGAVECFPKPLKATPEQFAKTVGKLGKIVIAAANSNVRDKPRNRGPRPEGETQAGYAPNGKIAAFSTSMGGVDALTEVLGHYPKNCPPTVIILQTEPMLAEMFIARADKNCACSVKAAVDGAELVAGTVHIAFDPGKHVIAASAPGKRKWSTSIDVTPATQVSVDVPTLADETGAQQVSVGDTPKTTGSSSSQKTIAVTAGVVGLVAVGAGTAFALKASSTWSDAKNHCTVYPTNCGPEGQSLSENAKSSANVATVAFAVGALGLAGGAILWLTAPKQSESEPKVSLGIGPGRVLLSGRF